MAQRYGRTILERHPHVDAVVGIADRQALADVCRKLLQGQPHKKVRGGSPTCRESPSPVIQVSPHATTAPDDRERLRLTPRHYTYLRISEGCDNRCAYCAIPEIRGPLLSKPPGQVLAEAEELAADGAKEIILIGQDTTAYGRDFPRGNAECGMRPALSSTSSDREPVERSKAEGSAESAGANKTHPAGATGCLQPVRAANTLADKPPVAPPALKQAKPWSLGTLLAELRGRIRVPWLRLMYTHPGSFSDDVIDQLAAGAPLVPYVDIPLQHASDPILASMGRRVGHETIEAIIHRLRGAVPGVALRTSFIVGYPGETEEHFEELLAFVEKVRFDHVGVFVYSPEPGTRAAGLPDQVPAEVARRRWDRLMAAAERLAFAAACEHVGRTVTVLVDGVEESGRLVARHAGQAPEVDSRVLLPAGSAEVGQMLQVRITAAEGYDLVGEPV
jgi:tRNA A37 methylthiotransferase MiaB